MLEQLKNQLTFHIIHGISQIEEDFRLKNLLAQLENLASKNKVIDSIYQDLSLILQEENKDKKTPLLQCLAKINGVLYVQGKSGVSLGNELEETIVFDEIRRELSSWKYSEIAPLILALMKKEKNRFQTIEWYLRNNPMVFSDFRIIRALVNGLSYRRFDIRGYCNEILLELGKKEREYSTSSSFVYYCVTKENPLPIVEPEILLLELKKDFDINGKSDMVERLELIGELGKEKENEWYRSLLESKKKEIRSKAIFNLKYSQDNIPLLLQLLENKKEKNTTEIYQVLSEMKYDNPEFWKDAIKKKIENIQYLEGYKSEKYLELYIDCCKFYIEMCVKKKKTIHYFLLEMILGINITETSDDLIDFYLWVLDYLKDSEEKYIFLSALQTPFIKKMYLNETPKMFEFMECLSEDEKAKCSGIYLVYDFLHFPIEEVIKKWKQNFFMLEEDDTMGKVQLSLWLIKEKFGNEIEWEKLYHHIYYCSLRIIVEYDLHYSRAPLSFAQIIKVANVKKEDPFQIKLGQYCYRILLELLIKKSDYYYIDVSDYVFLLNTLEYDFLDIALDFTRASSKMNYSEYALKLEVIFSFLHKFYQKEKIEEVEEKVLALYSETRFEPENFDGLKERLNNL